MKTVRKSKKIEMEKSPKNFRRLLFWVLPLLAGSFLLLFRLCDVAGLHRDEATFGLFAEQIQNGLRPIRAYFNDYTSPIHSYIIAACFSIFGKSIWSLRINGVLLNLLAAIAYVDVVRRIVPKRAVWTLWFLVTLPAFVVMSRISGENYALNPLLLFGGIWCYYVLGSGGSSKWRSRPGYALSGLLLCLGVWNHIVFLPTAAAVIVAYAIASRAQLRRIINTAPWFFAGVFVGLVPKLYGVLFLGYDILPPDTDNLIRSPLSAALLNMIYTLGGDALYIRACGEILLPHINWIGPLAVVASTGILLSLKSEGNRKKTWVYVALCMVLSVAGTWFITPAGSIGSRIWLLPLWFAPLLVAVSLPDSRRLVRIGLGAALIVINISALGVNYFHNFLQDGGIPKEKVYVGGRYDNSWDFIDMRPLVKKLESCPDRGIYIIEDYNSDRLRFFAPAAARDRIRTIRILFPDENEDIPEIPIHSLIILYKEPSRKPELNIRIRRNVVIKAIRRADLSTNHYDVYEVVAGCGRFCFLHTLRPERR